VKELERTQKESHRHVKREWTTWKGLWESTKRYCAKYKEVMCKITCREMLKEVKILILCVIGPVQELIASILKRHQKTNNPIPSWCLVVPLQVTDKLYCQYRRHGLRWIGARGCYSMSKICFFMRPHLFWELSSQEKRGTSEEGLFRRRCELRAHMRSETAFWWHRRTDSPFTFPILVWGRCRVQDPFSSGSFWWSMEGIEEGL
jgi:hypothetical protein